MEFLLYSHPVIGNILSKYSVFLGDHDMTELTELRSGIPAGNGKLYDLNQAVHIAFDFEHLNVYSPSSSGSPITSRVIPTWNQIISSKYFTS
jgi:hypothetical protein